MINYTEKYGLLEFLNSNNVYHRVSDNVHIFDSEKLDSAIQKLINDYDPIHIVRDEALARVNIQLQTYLDELVTRKYSRAEQDTFPYQRLEIEAWRKDNTALTPTLDKIALNRGVSRDDQLARVNAKTLAFQSVSDTSIGKCQKLKDQIKASTDLDYINSINFEG